MSDAGKTEAVSVHYLRRSARKRERELQNLMRHGGTAGLPEWARGVRVERVGPLCWAVIATEERGH